MTAKRLGQVVIASKSGRLGNRLFLSSYFMANALSRGYQLINLALGEYAVLYEGSADDPICSFPRIGKVYDPDFSSQCRELLLGLGEGLGSIAGHIGLPGVRLLDIRKGYDSDDRIYDLNGDHFTEALISTHILLVKGWKFRDVVNVVRFHPEIRSYFTPVPSVRLLAERTIEEARSRGDQVIGVHIRQGDYRGWKNGIHYFETTQYVHWMRQAEGLFSGRKTAFLICASNPIDKHEFCGVETVYGPGYAAADLHALSLCDLIIGPPSTFSSWASYFGSVPFCMMEHHEQSIAKSSFVLHDGV